ncbi:MAG: ankyrin repeat domain-containing protein [Steroidobacteraceae bacterium]
MSDSDAPAMSARRIFGYAAFFLIGLIELRFQWHLLFDLDRSGIVQYYFESLLLIPLLAIFGCWRAFRSSDPVLRLLAIATLFVAMLQVTGEVVDPSQLTRDLVNGIDRAYGVMCVIAWPLACVTRGGRPAALMLAALVAVSVPLSVAWNWQRQEFVWKRQAPTPVDCELFVAAEGGDLGRVQAALAAGARIDIAAKGGWEALMYAVNRGDPAIVQLLIQRGANPNRREDMLGSRCLDPCAANGCRGWAATDGRTPLMTAAVWGYTEIVRVLLEAGADPLLHDAEGKTARDWAKWANKPETAALLREAELAGGKTSSRR